MKNLIFVFFVVLGLSGCTEEAPERISESRQESVQEVVQAMTMLQTADLYYRRMATTISTDCSRERIDVRDLCYKAWIEIQRESFNSIFNTVWHGVEAGRFNKDWGNVWRKHQKPEPLPTCKKKARGYEQLLVCYLKEEAWLTAWAEFHDNGRFIGELATDPDYIKKSGDYLASVKDYNPEEEEDFEPPPEGEE